PLRVDTNPRTVQLMQGIAEAETYPPLKAQLAAELGRTRSPATAASLRAMLTHDDVLVRAAATRSLATIRDDGALTLVEDPSPLVRREVAAAAAALGAADVVSTLLSDADPSVVLAASAGV